MQVSEKDVKVILAKANAGVPLKVVEIHRLVAASGVEVPKPRRFRQIVQATEDKLATALREVLVELDRMQEPEPRPVGRKRLRKVRT
jgi:hypothetical protein